MYEDKTLSIAKIIQNCVEFYRIYIFAFCIFMCYTIHMQKENYYLKMLAEIESLHGKKMKLLLHSCCGPCSTHCIEMLRPHFDVTVLFYNPNITEEAEYLKRKETQLQCLQQYTDVSFMDCDYNTDVFFAIAKGREGLKEGGARCYLCYDLRIDYTAQMAEKNEYTYFCSTLSVSPHKNSAWINKIGEKLQQKYAVKWLPSDFKKQNGYRTSVMLAQKQNLYRQNYCGCVYSNWQKNENKEKEIQKKMLEE